MRPKLLYLFHAKVAKEQEERCHSSCLSRRHIQNPSNHAPDKSRIKFNPVMTRVQRPRRISSQSCLLRCCLGTFLKVELLPIDTALLQVQTDADCLLKPIFTQHDHA